MPSANIQPPFPAYGGSDPYLFISYAHADAQLVFAELTRIRQWGANIWYDEGIDPGNEWPEEIAQALNTSALVIYFVTPRSVTSVNCRNELYYALSLNKPLLVVHLEETVLPAGIGLRISSIQAILKYNMDVGSYGRKLKDSLKDFFRDENGTGAGIKVAIVDSGIEISHPSLAGLKLADDIALKMGEDGIVTTEPGNGVDVYGHGTAIAGILRERAPEATLGSFRILDERLSSKNSIYQEGFNKALDAGYHIILAAPGGRTPELMLALKSVVDQAYRRGIHVVGAANNNYEKDEEYPCSFATVIGVSMSASCPPDQIYRRRGGVIPFYALGVDVEVLWKNGVTIKKSSTSFAAARVAGILASTLSKVGNCSPLEAQLLLEKKSLPWTRAIAGPNMALTYEEAEDDLRQSRKAHPAT